MQLCIGNWECLAGTQIIFPESGRGLHHVTATIFGSTVGYPSDSLASCYLCLIVLINTLCSVSTFTGVLCGDEVVWGHMLQGRSGDGDSSDWNGMGMGTVFSGTLCRPLCVTL